MKKKTFIVADISGKVLNYDYALCEAMTAQTGSRVVLAAHLHDKQKYRGKRLWLASLVPAANQLSTGRLKRLVKAFEGVLNYAILLGYAMLRRPAVIHFQWFPYLEFSSMEIPYVRLFRWVCPKAKIVHTIHNVFPHGMKENSKAGYRERMRRMDSLVDHYIVHTESTVDDVEREFGIDRSRVSVVAHGIFKPDYVLKETERKDGEKKTIIFYGINRENKGADIMIEAVKLLPEQLRSKVRILIAGKTSGGYLERLQQLADGVDVTFRPTFIPDAELYDMINRADYIALPYRNISQSGVLLLALYFRKPLLISDLPSFRETLRGFAPDMFFETGSAQSMSGLIARTLEGKVDTEQELKVIDELNKEYSWENSAKKTLAVYNKIFCEK